MNNQISHLAPGSSIAELLPSTAALPWPCCRSSRRNLCVIGARSEAAHSPLPAPAGRQAGRQASRQACTAAVRGQRAAGPRELRPWPIRLREAC